MTSGALAVAAWMVPAVLAACGWFVVHAGWIAALAAGVAGLILAALDDRRATARHQVALAALILCVAAPAMVVLTAWDPLPPMTRARLTGVVDGTVGFDALVAWRGLVVRGAGAVWILGVVWQTVRVGIGWRRVRRLRARSVAAPPVLQAEVAAVAEGLGVRRRIEVRCASEALGPMVAGWRRAVVLVPRSLAVRLEPAERRAILAHEVAHVRRGDPLVNGWQLGMDVVLWWHPAARWLSRRARTEREYCCDDAAVAATSAECCVRALAGLDRAYAGAGVVLGAASGTLLDRMRRLAGRPRVVWTGRRAAAAFVAALLAAVVWLSLAMTVPPAVPLDAKLRMRRPGPVPSEPADPDLSRPRSRR